MAEKKDTNKIITIILTVVIIIAIITIVYINLPQEQSGEDTNIIDNDNGEIDINEDEVILTLSYGENQVNYSLEQLEALESYTSKGGYINKVNNTMGPYNFTGVPIYTLISQEFQIPINITISITASDGYTKTYTKNETLGFVEIKNETGAYMYNSGATMIIAYKEEGEYITDTEVGPLRVAFIDEYYTSSSLWLKMVESIEITQI